MLCLPARREPSLERLDHLLILYHFSFKATSFCHALLLLSLMQINTILTTHMLTCTLTASETHTDTHNTHTLELASLTVFHDNGL